MNNLAHRVIAIDHPLFMDATRTVIEELHTLEFTGPSVDIDAVFDILFETLNDDGDTANEKLLWLVHNAIDWGAGCSLRDIDSCVEQLFVLLRQYRRACYGHLESINLINPNHGQFPFTYKGFLEAGIIVLEWGSPDPGFNRRG